MDISEQLRRGARAVASVPIINSMWERSRLARRLQERFRAGATAGEAADMALELRQTGTQAAFDLLRAAAQTRAEADAARAEYDAALDTIEARSIAEGEFVDLTVRLGALGLHLPDGAAVALGHARELAARATALGTAITLGLEPHPWTAAVLDVAERLRAEHPRTGVTVDTRLHRTEADVAALTGPGVRVRVVQGPRDQPREVAWHDQHEADLAWVRCVRTLMLGQGEPLVEPDSTLLTDVAAVIANLAGRPVASFEYQVTLGGRTEEALRLSDSGYRVRIRLPYGQGWYAEALQQMVDRPESMSGLLRPVSNPDLDHHPRPDLLRHERDLLDRAHVAAALRSPRTLD